MEKELRTPMCEDCQEEHATAYVKYPHGEWFPLCTHCFIQHYTEYLEGMPMEFKKMKKVAENVKTKKLVR